MNNLIKNGYKRKSFQAVHLIKVYRTKVFTRYKAAKLIRNSMKLYFPSFKYQAGVTLHVTGYLEFNVTFITVMI
jgi:hypothetical protein